MTANLMPKALRKFMAAALEKFPSSTEWIDPHLLTRNHWPTFNQALLRLHQPKVYDPDGFHIARQRLAYDEALAREMAMGQARLARERRHAPAIPRAVGAEKRNRRSAPLQADPRPAGRLLRRRHRHGPPRAHAPHDPGRCRLRQNARRRPRSRTGRRQTAASPP